MLTPTDAVHRLTGVVMHHGTSPSLSGHYTFIKEDSGKPIQIDDDIFRIFYGTHLLLFVTLLTNSRRQRYLPSLPSRYSDFGSSSLKAGKCNELAYS